MRLGIFDLGMGGLLIARSILEHISDIDMTYFGDTLHVPYGARSKEAIYQYTEKAIDYLFSEHDCQLIILACNTATAAALRRLQQEYLPEKYPDRRILGVVVPTLEAAATAQYKRIGMIATKYVINSNIYHDELFKIDPRIELLTNPAPLLVPLIENNGEPWLRDVLEKYLLDFRTDNIEALILGCTHYAYVQDMARDIMGPNVKILSQTDILPQKLVRYLERHPEINEKISYKKRKDFFLTDLTDTYINMSARLYGDEVIFQQASLPT